MLYLRVFWRALIASCCMVGALCFQYIVLHMKLYNIYLWESEYARYVVFRWLRETALITALFYAWFFCNSLCILSITRVFLTGDIYTCSMIVFFFHYVVKLALPNAYFIRSIGIQLYAAEQCFIILFRAEVVRLAYSIASVWFKHIVSFDCLLYVCCKLLLSIAFSLMCS